MLKGINIKSFSFILILFVFFSCKKKEMLGNEYETKISDTALTITSINLVGINSFDVNYQVKPSTNESYSDVFLEWSNNDSFIQQKDSVLIANSINTTLTNVAHLINLNQNTQYYFRIKIKYKSNTFFSKVVTSKTESFRIVSAGYNNSNFSYHDDTTMLVTSLKSINNGLISSSEVFLNEHQCQVVKNKGDSIFFLIPEILTPHKYILKVKNNGLTAIAKDSFDIQYPGIWSTLKPPVLPLNPNASTSGLMYFGTANSNEKGYIIGGSFFNGYDPSDAIESQISGYLYELDLKQQLWTKKPLSNKKYFENPICYYYNNSIYVISSFVETILTNTPWNSWYSSRIYQKKMKRLDLSTYTWYDMDPLPFPTINNMVSFKINNEWYIGMGTDSSNLSRCCGNPLPSNKFWKYNPSNNQWTSIANFPGTMQRTPASAFSINDNGYVFCGYIPRDINSSNETNFSTEFWKYNATSNTWQQIPNQSILYPPVGEKYQIITNKGKAYFLTSQKYVFGGLFYDFDLENVCLEYNPNTNNFRKVTKMWYDNIIKPLGNIGSKYYFHSDAFGYTKRVPNITYEFNLE